MPSSYKNIRANQWIRLNRFLSDLHALRTIREFFPFCLEEFPRLLDCPYLAWDEFDPSLQISGFQSTASYRADLERAFPDIIATIDSHPIISSLDLLRNPRRLFSVYSTTDFATDTEFRETPLYREAYRHVEAEYQLYTDIYFSEDHHAGISINSSRKFTDEQRAMAEIACRHIEVAYSRILAVRSVMTDDSDSRNESFLQGMEKRLRQFFGLYAKGLPSARVCAEMNLSRNDYRDCLRETRKGSRLLKFVGNFRTGRQNRLDLA